MILSSVHQLERTPSRIISLVPSQTELLHYFGLEAETIAITKFCIHPAEWFQNKPRVGGTKSLNIDKITELKPDLIIANHEENEKEQIEALAKNFPVWVTDVKSLDGSIKMIDDIGYLVVKEEEARSTILKIKHEFDSLKNELSNWLVDPLRVAYFIWKDPYMTIGGDTFINDMLQRCHFKNLFEEASRYPEVKIEALKALNCDLVLLSSEPFPFTEKHKAELQALLPRTKVILADGEMFSWYGSRLIQSPAYFIKLIQGLFKSIY